MTRTRRRQFLGFVALFLAGCTGATVSSPSAAPSADLSKNVTASPSAAKSGAPMATLPKEIRFTVTDEIGMKALEANYSELRAALEQALGTKVTLVPVEDQVSGAVLIKQGKVDLALVGPSEYVVIRARTNAVPVIAITRPNYLSVLATKANSSIKTIADLKGKAIAMSDVGSTSGHLGPVKMLIDAGLDPQSDVTIKMLGDDGSIAALKKGDVEAWGGSLTDYEEMSAKDPAAFAILEKGPLLPNDVFVASSQMPSEVVATLQKKLLENAAAITTSTATHEKKYVGSTLQTAKDAEYDPIRAAYKTIGQGKFLQ